MSEVVPLPNQVAFWWPENYSGAEPGTTSDPQFLTCLKATQAGDRQLVWQGVNGGGITAVVDFGEPPRYGDDRRHNRWGCITALDPAIAFETVKSHPILGPRLTGVGGRALQRGPIKLSDEEALAVYDLTDLPPFYGPLDGPTSGDVSERLEGWGRMGSLTAEAVIEVACSKDRRLWRPLGFSRAPAMQQRLANGRPDLLAPGRVGEAKRLTRSDDGPAQIERYIDELERTRPSDGPWSGVLLQTVLDMDAVTRQRVADSAYALEAWAIVPTPMREFRAVRLV